MTHPCYLTNKSGKLLITNNELLFDVTRIFEASDVLFVLQLDALSKANLRNMPEEQRSRAFNEFKQRTNERLLITCQSLLT